ncbi:hypothetical protein DFH27DRAFT_52220 [Peziza echinospora]|nr:hypothetical protein DFH27DRAFT_52220 [Peziza echinospora]
MRQSRPTPLTLKSTAPGGFRDGHHADPDREIIRALSPTTERELRRSCSAVVLGHASSPSSQQQQQQQHHHHQVQQAQVRPSAVPRPLPTPAFPQKQSWQGRIAPQAAVMAQQVPTTTLAQFDFRMPTSTTTSGESSSHSLSSSISSTFSDDVNGPSWSPCTTHHSKSSDGDQYIVHAQTSDTVFPPLPHKPNYSPSSPPPRYAFAKTATARKMSLNYQQINPRASSIISIAAQEAGQPSPPIARPTMINVPRPRTSSGVPGSPRFRNSSVPSINPDGASLRKKSDASTIAPPPPPPLSAGGNGGSSQLGTPVGLGFAMEFPSSKLSRSETPDTISRSHVAEPPRDSPPSSSSSRKQETPATSSSPPPPASQSQCELSPAPAPTKVSRAKSSHQLTRDSRPDQIRSTTSTPGIGSSSTSSGRPFSPPSLSRRKTDMDPGASNPKKFSLFPCQMTPPIIIKDSPHLGGQAGFTNSNYHYHGSTSPLQSGVTSRSMSISSAGAGRPRTAGGAEALPRTSGESSSAAWDRQHHQLPSLPATLANHHHHHHHHYNQNAAQSIISSAVSVHSNGSISNMPIHHPSSSSHGNGGSSSTHAVPSVAGGGKQKKGAFKSLRKHVLASFQNFSGSLKIGSGSHGKAGKELSGSSSSMGMHTGGVVASNNSWPEAVPSSSGGGGGGGGGGNGSMGRKSMSLGHRASRSLLRGGMNWREDHVPPSPSPAPAPQHQHQQQGVRGAAIGCAN